MLNIQGAWEGARNYLEDRLGKTVFETWILPLKPKIKSENALVLEAPDAFFRDWVEKHYSQVIQEAVNQSAKKEVALHLETASQARARPSVRKHCDHQSRPMNSRRSPI